MELRYKIIVNAARDAIVCADNQGKITFLNPAALELFGYEAKEPIGADLTILMPARFRRSHRAGLKRLVTTGKSRIMGQTIELVGLKSDGTEFPLELSLSRYGAGGNLETIGMIRDITLRKNLQEQLEKQATTDYLTGLGNRQAFDRKLAEEWQRATRYKKPLSLFLADLDHFKEYNDIYGHQAGDIALKSISEAIHSMMRTVDLVARYGGEEIAAVLPETNHTKAAALAERILIAVQNLGIKHTGFPETGLLTVSIGVAELSPEDIVSYSLVKRADTALYHAKRLGRNRVSIDTDVDDQTPILKAPATRPQSEILS